MGFITTPPCGCALQMHAARAAATSPAPVDKLSALLNSKIFARASRSLTRSRRRAMSASDEGPSEASSSAAEDKDEKPEENGEDEESSESSSSSDSNETASVPPLSDNEERQAPLEEIEVSSDSESDEESDSRPAKGGKRGAKANGKAAQKPKPAARAKKPYASLSLRRCSSWQ